MATYAAGIASNMISSAPYYVREIMSARSTLQWLSVGCAALLCSLVGRSLEGDEPPVAVTAAKPSVLADPTFFPLAVWLQNPSNAARYKAAGINLYVGLWRGPTEEQLAQLREQGMYVICSQNVAGLAHKDDPTIVGWM